MKGHQNTGAATVSVASENVSTFRKIATLQPALQLIQNIPASSMCEDAVRLSLPEAVELTNRPSRQLGHTAMKFISQFAIRIHKPDLFPLLGPMQCLKSACFVFMLPGSVRPDSCSSTISKKTKADQDPSVIVKIKRG
tara:strand:+ start:117 stop:530 length:414 start_codon:yes stop_codon:yes gene_type:complete